MDSVHSSEARPENISLSGHERRELGRGNVAEFEVITDRNNVESPVQELEEPSLMTIDHTTTQEMSDTLQSMNAMSIDETPMRSSNPASISEQIRGLRESLASARTMMSSIDTPTRRNTDPAYLSSRHDSMEGEPAMSGPLPEDDGMTQLRAQMRQIQTMAASSEEKARRMHALMTADYEAMQAGKARALAALGNDARLRSMSPMSIGSGYDPENPYNIQPGDKDPTFAPATLEPTTPLAGTPNDSDEEPELELGCQHYRRNVKVQCPDCRAWFPCRFCHDEVISDHQLERRNIRNMLCMICATPQRAAEYCRKCESLTACYYCDECKLWDNDATHNIYHCEDCGICRRGRGLGKDYVHCQKCKVCISVAWASAHRCVEGATDRDCPICGDYMFNATAAVVAMKCGHYIHRKCYDAHMESSYKCPVCNKSAVNMELQWRKLDHAIEQQPMPDQYSRTKAHILCNDCSARSSVKYHWLGNKCPGCDSYNTLETRIEDNPAEDEVDAAAEQRMVDGSQQIFTRPPNAPSPAPIELSEIPPTGRETSILNGHEMNENSISSPTAVRGRQPAFMAHSPTWTNATTVATATSPVFSAADGHSQQSSIEEELPEDDSPSVCETDADQEDMTFWGGNIASSDWLNGPRSWNAPSFLASRFGGDHIDPDATALEPPTPQELQEAQERGWHFPTPSWPSTQLFGGGLLRRYSAPQQEAGERPSSWSLPRPRWPQQRFFGNAETVLEDPSVLPDGEVSSGWRIPTLPRAPWPNTRFFAERFGTAEGFLPEGFTGRFGSRPTTADAKRSEAVIDDGEVEEGIGSSDDDSEFENEDTNIDETPGANDGPLNFELLGHR